MGKILALLLMALGLVKGGLDYEEGQCGLAENCCVGRDSSCVVHGLQTNGKIVRDACYCDEGCLDTGDCCSDYESVCNAELLECQLSSWSDWSKCNRRCGKGVQSRSRVIVQQPSPGMPPCETLKQKRVCQGSRCSFRDKKFKNPIRETAGLLPARYFEQRYKTDYEVRENLFEHQKKLSQKPNWNINSIEDGYQADQPYVDHSADHFQTKPNEYCIVFELAKVTKACHFDKDFYKMQKGQQMCALCPSDAQRESLGGRCKGHGVDSHLTKWRSTFKPKCHGKWRRVKEMRECPCLSGPDYVFI